MMSKEKKCAMCNNSFPESEFFVRKHKKGAVSVSVSSCCPLCREILKKQYQQRANEKMKARYAEDAEYRKKRLAQAKPAQRRRKFRYAEDAEYRKKVLEQNKRYVEKQLSLDPDFIRKKTKKYLLNKGRKNFIKRQAIKKSSED